MEQREKKKYVAPVLTKVSLDEEGFVSLGACKKDLAGLEGCWQEGIPGGQPEFTFDPS